MNEYYHAESMIEKLNELRNVLETPAQYRLVADCITLIELVMDVLDDENDSIDIQNKLYEFMS